MQIMNRWKSSRMDSPREEAGGASILRVFWPFQLSSQLRSAESSQILYGCVIPHKSYSNVDNVAFSVVVMGAHPASANDPRAAAQLQHAIKHFNSQLAKQPTTPSINPVSLIGEWLAAEEDEPTVAPAKARDSAAFWLQFRGLIDCRRRAPPSGEASEPQEYRGVPHVVGVGYPPLLDAPQLQVRCCATATGCTAVV